MNVGAEQGGVEDVQPVLFACSSRFVDEVMEGEEVGSVPVLDCLHRESQGDMCFSDAGGAEDEDVLSLMQEPQGGEFLNGGFGNAGLRIKVERVEGFPGGDAGEFEVRRDPPLEAVLAFGGQELIEQPGDASLFSGALLEERIELGSSGVELQDLEVLLDSLVVHGFAHEVCA